MNADKWEDVKTNIERKFGILEQGREDLLVETEDGLVKQGEAEFMVFETPLGKLKLQLTHKPKVENKKYHYSHRQGTAARVEYKFSDSETVSELRAFKWDEIDNDFKEIDAEKFNF